MDTNIPVTTGEGLSSLLESDVNGDKKGRIGAVAGAKLSPKNGKIVCLGIATSPTCGSRAFFSRGKGLFDPATKTRYYDLKTNKQAVRVGKLMRALEEKGWELNFLARAYGVQIWVFYPQVREWQTGRNRQ